MRRGGVERLLHFRPNEVVAPCRQRDGGENAEDREHDHELDDGEAVLLHAGVLAAATISRLPPDVTQGPATA